MKRVKLKRTFHLILLCFHHKKCAKSHKQSQFTSKFIPTSIHDICKSDGSCHTIRLHHLRYANWRLKICILRLYFSSWSPKVDLRIFLISSPVGGFAYKRWLHMRFHFHYSNNIIIMLPVLLNFVKLKKIISDI